MKTSDFAYDLPQELIAQEPLKERDHGPDALRYFAKSLPDWRFE